VIEGRADTATSVNAGGTWVKGGQQDQDYSETAGEAETRSPRKGLELSREKQHHWERILVKGKKTTLRDPRSQPVESGHGGDVNRPHVPQTLGN